MTLIFLTIITLAVTTVILVLALELSRYIKLKKEINDLHRSITGKLADHHPDYDFSFIPKDGLKR